ncbi:hypothetical protein ACLI4Q_07000 [Natrialbaceae archaeon A-CW1-1]
MAEEHLTLEELTESVAAAIPVVDSKTNGQYGAGIGSENEEHQLELLLNRLRNMDERYEEIDREVPYPEHSGVCDLLLPQGTPVEAKLIRYWRANGDPEPNMYKHIFSPFHQNTLLTDAHRLHESSFDKQSGLLGLFYTRADEDPKTVEALPDRYTATNIAEKVVRDIQYWYEIDASVCTIVPFDGLQHTVHKQGAAISWVVR